MNREDVSLVNTACMKTQMTGVRLIMSVSSRNIVVRTTILFPYIKIHEIIWTYIRGTS